MNFRLASANGFPVGLPMQMTEQTLEPSFWLSEAGCQSLAASCSPRSAARGVRRVRGRPGRPRAGCRATGLTLAGQPRRLAFWANLKDPHQWAGDIHSHPTHWCGFLKSG